jgi:hypothetical protein
MASKQVEVMHNLNCVTCPHCGTVTEAPKEYTPNATSSRVCPTCGEIFLLTIKQALLITTTRVGAVLPSGASA